MIGPLKIHAATLKKGHGSAVAGVASARLLRKSELRYRRLFETAQDGILILDAATGAISDVNPYLISMLGYTRKELVKRKLWEVGAFRDVESNRNSFEALQKDEFIRYEDLPLKTKDGRLIQVEFVSNVYLVGDEKVIQCNIRDVSARKKAEADLVSLEKEHWLKVQRHLEHLTALVEIDRAINFSFELNLSLATLLTHAIIQLDVDAADVLLYNPVSRKLEYVAGRGFHGKAIEKSCQSLGEGCAGLAAQERRIVHIPDLANVQVSFLRKVLLSGEDFVSYDGVPLIAKGQVVGVLEVFQRTKIKRDDEWLDFLKALASQAAIAIDNATLFDNLQRSNTELFQAYDATIEGWSRALELRDNETEGHSQRAAVLTVKLARLFGMSDAELVQVRWGALLHDIGKMAIPDSILRNDQPLSNAEWVVMKKHTVYAYEMLSPIRYLHLALDIPCSHHEKWDGSGYPLGLKREQIPLTARIFALVDVWDALRTDRIYRTSWSVEKVREHLLSLAGTHFDPHVVQVCLDSNLFSD
jgi:PAS domain S-box-containing protein/putative nucleotidyltransferase with HDIG domain